MQSGKTTSPIKMVKNQSAFALVTLGPVPVIAQYVIFYIPLIRDIIPKYHINLQTVPLDYFFIWSPEFNILF